MRVEVLPILIMCAVFLALTSIIAYGAFALKRKEEKDIEEWEAESKLDSDPTERIRDLLFEPPIGDRESGISAVVFHAGENGSREFTLRREDTFRLASSIIRTEFDNYCRYITTEGNLRVGLEYRPIHSLPENVEVEYLYEMARIEPMDSQTLNVIIHAMQTIMTNFLIESMDSGFLLYGVRLKFDANKYG